MNQTTARNQSQSQSHWKSHTEQKSILHNFIILTTERLMDGITCVTK